VVVPRERLEERELVREELIDRPDRGLGACRDSLHRRRLVALLGEHVRGGLDDALDALLRPLLRRNAARSLRCRRLRIRIRRRLLH